MKYNNFDLEDFLKDKHFISWVLQPTAESNRFWENWLKSNPEAVLKVRKAREIIQSASFKVPVKNLDAKQEVLEKIMKGYTSQHSYQINNYRNHTYLKVAATLLILLIAGLVIWQSADLPETEDKAMMVPQIVKRSEAGQKINITLPDGSKVVLNALASVTYPKEFDQERRLITLSGEAFFEVKEDQNRPFIVVTDNLEARVLGTSFNINNNSVALLTGKLEVTNKDVQQEGIVLVPGQKVIHDNSKNSLYKTYYDYQREIAWKDGIIYFEDANYAEISNTLENWYGVTFILQDKHNYNWSYTGMFDNASLEEVLERISYLEGFDFKITEKTVTISKS